MAMRKRNWQVGAALVAGLAALQSPLMLPAGLVLLGRWVYLDTAARGVRNPIAWAIIVPISWIFMLPVYLARRPLVAGEVRAGGTWWNLLRAFAATYAVGTALLGLRYARLALFGLDHRRGEQCGHGVVAVRGDPVADRIAGRACPRCGHASSEADDGSGPDLFPDRADIRT
jgi:hypothetical protein